MKRAQKITLGEMRPGNGPRRLIVYCSDFQCSHSVVIDAAPWGDNYQPVGSGAEIHLQGLWPPRVLMSGRCLKGEDGNGRRLGAFSVGAGPEPSGVIGMERRPQSTPMDRGRFSFRSRIT